MDDAALQVVSRVPEPREVFARQIDAPAIGIFGEVSQNVRQLQGESAVDGGDHAMHANASVACHRHLGHFGHDRAEGGVQSHAASTRATVGGWFQRCAPSTLGSGQLQHAQRARMRLQQRGAIRRRVLLGGGREFVDKALDEERLM